MPKLSIIIPTYNSAATICRCLESIAVQTFADYEVIVQDGSPNDDTATQIEEFQRTHEKLSIRLYREPDGGIYDAMNRAVLRAAGKWLYFLGSDDELHDEHVLATVMGLEPATSCGVLYGDVRVVGECSWVAASGLYDGPFNFKKLLTKNICQQAIFYRADIAHRAGEFSQNYPVLADWDFNLRCWSLTKFKYIGVTVARYSVTGVSSTHDDERFRAEIAASVLRYFGLSLLSPTLNARSFIGLRGIMDLQKAKGEPVFTAGRVVRRLLRLWPE